MSHSCYQEFKKKTACLHFMVQSIENERITVLDLICRFSNSNEGLLTKVSFGEGKVDNVVYHP